MTDIGDILPYEKWKLDQAHKQQSITPPSIANQSLISSNPQNYISKLV